MVKEKVQEPKDAMLEKAFEMEGKVFHPEEWDGVEIDKETLIGWINRWIAEWEQEGGEEGTGYIFSGRSMIVFTTRPTTIEIAVAEVKYRGSFDRPNPYESATEDTVDDVY